MKLIWLGFFCTENSYVSWNQLCLYNGCLALYTMIKQMGFRRQALFGMNWHSLFRSGTGWVKHTCIHTHMHTQPHHTHKYMHAHAPTSQCSNEHCHMITYRTQIYMHTQRHTTCVVNWHILLMITQRCTCLITRKLCERTSGAACSFQRSSPPITTRSVRCDGAGHIKYAEQISMSFLRSESSEKFLLSFFQGT